MLHLYLAALVVVIAANVVAIVAIATTIKRDVARAWGAIDQVLALKETAPGGSS
jgi:hypothetical protein